MSSAPVTLIGNLTKDPDIKYMESGTAKTEFSIAVNHSWKDANDEWQQKTSYFDCVLWRGAAEDAARILEKGLGVVVVGRLEQRTWDDKDTGQKRSKVEVIVDNVAIQVRAVDSIDRRQATDSPAKKAQPVKKAAAKGRPAPEDEPF